MSAMFVNATSALVTHLWQSTLFGVVAAALTLALRGNPASIRFNVWFIASAKFLIPFTLFASLGELLSTHSSRGKFAALIELPAMRVAPFRSSAFNRQAWSEQHSEMIVSLFWAVWLAGILCILAFWAYRWWLVARATRSANPLATGDEPALLRRVAAQMRVEPIPILLSSTRVEPGIVGLWRPALLWPAGLTEILDEAQITAIVAHEFCHVRRYDNLLASVQMVVAAIFWFHPLVWWFGRQQMEERERACDESVLASGIPPDIYAGSILAACKFCVEVPLPCVAGVNGSNLKQRITRIMTTRSSVKLSTAKKLVLSTAGAASVAVPILIGMSTGRSADAQAAATAIPSAPLHVTALSKDLSGDPMTQMKHTSEGTTIRNTTVRNLIEMAYSVKSYQLSGGPAWINQEHFDLAYTGGEPTAPQQGMVSPDALKEILAERFHLVMHQETKPGPVLALVVSDGGPKFHSVTPKMLPGTNEPLLSMRMMQKDGKGSVAITGGPTGLAEALSGQVRQPVIDKTGLSGVYSINFEWVDSSLNANSLSRALQQQLGLTLSPQEGAVQTSTVESIELPALLSSTPRAFHPPESPGTRGQNTALLTGNHRG